MIRTKKELLEYLKYDSKNYEKVSHGLFRFLYHLKADSISDQWYIWKYIVAMRHVEYYSKGKCFFFMFMKYYWLHRLRRYAYITGIQIPPHTIEKGLTIWHWGDIIVNPSTKIGENCTIYPGVLIGHKSPGGIAPKIGNNVFIGSGTKIIGSLTIGDNVIIGPNTVIVRDIPSDCTVVGNPARIIKFNKLIKEKNHNENRTC